VALGSFPDKTQVFPDFQRTSERLLCSSLAEPSLDGKHSGYQPIEGTCTAIEFAEGINVVKQIKVLLVDDNQKFLQVLKEYFLSSPAFPVVGVAESGNSAIRQVQELQPDLVFMDIAMPGINGLQATREIKQLSNPPRVIMLTVFDDAEYRRASAAAGADGFINKAEVAKEMPNTLEKLFGMNSSTNVTMLTNKRD